MKKLLLSALLGSLLILSANEAPAEGADEAEELPAKTGFLATKWCVNQGLLADCRLESYYCGDGGCYKKWNPGDEVTGEMVLYVHDEQKTYALDISAVPRHEFDEGVNRNLVEISGVIEGDKIIAKHFKAPPPPGKSFFKGCL